MTDLAGRARRIMVLSAGLSAPSSTRSLADRLAEATQTAIQTNGSRCEIETVELSDLAMDVTRCLLQGFAGPELEDALERLASADGAIVVTPIFSASYSGVFKSFIDVVEPGAISGLPVLLGATGGTERHSLALDFALRPLFSYHRAIALPTGVFAATSDWGTPGSAAVSGLASRIDRAASELSALAVRDRPRAPGPQVTQPGGAGGATRRTDA